MLDAWRRAILRVSRVHAKYTRNSKYVGVWIDLSTRTSRQKVDYWGATLLQHEFEIQIWTNNVTCFRRGGEGPWHIPMELWYWPPPNLVVTKVPIFGFFCMIPSEKGSVFSDFWYVENPKKSPFFLLTSTIMFRYFQASEAPGHRIECIQTLRDGYHCDKYDDYLGNPCFLLRPIFLLIILPTFILSFLESTPWIRTEGIEWCNKMLVASNFAC